IPHRSVSRHHIQVALRISGHAGPALPHASGVSVGRGIVDNLLLQRRGVVSQYPSMIRPPIAVGRKRDVHEAVDQRQSLTLVLPHAPVMSVFRGGRIPGAVKLFRQYSLPLSPSKAYTVLLTVAM